MIAAELRVVDPRLVLVRRQRDRRLEQGLARDHVIAAGQLLAEPAQMDPREITCVPADPMSMPTLVRVTWSWPDRILLERPVV